MTGALVIIPARMAATRLPRKPLADICGKPMIVRVVEQALNADIGPVVVATDTQEIADAVEKAGCRAVLTRPDHPSGSDRIHEAVDLVDPDRTFDTVLNVQGDVPLIEPDAIRAALSPLSIPEVAIGTIVTEFTSAAFRDDPNFVKAIATPNGQGQLRTLYFSRATAPYGDGVFYHHIGIYAYRRAALAKFVSLPPAPLEQREKLEQLRALEAGMRIDASVISSAPMDVNTPDDLERARAAYQSL
ncbi:3-deoxy-manno-octulosonate cytidylyltransferase [Roseibium denhamense]|uniref:3-deoxy-manno-octulosonate cytidylyltransferase (CMP-KDO synthetase) n=1 Tax=Roseibium denhamense TaxID=76305 RepID=A0ABY1PLR7_9HYPH|nr:3-deoxy-manno-octulosonate cytidylyltransferase [Roseibium denhamense]MTI06915.1 3-deoxy-manno-octulosonate cytidylyltransferase [Roseibium denhamense]SMP36774.1 3-deoxy-manno-octulosonate cytidylyltransferase (CMP-KDO synthetase) [Roseibium denhamense]